MSRHEGVSCDSCLVGNFRGRRYKCLICYDYDLCPTCYEAGATSTRHTAEHPMQCILTRSDFDLYYGGEAISVEQPQSFTCPYCGKMGFTEVSLQEHVSSEHSDTSFEVVCPVCAALPGGDPNLVTDDFAAHLTLEHRSPRDLDEPSSSRHVRRIPHPGRGVGATRARRSNMHFSSSGGLASLSPSSRDSMDPIAELLSQLSGVRRSGANSQSTTTSQLQQLQMQLQLERQQAQVARQQLERLPRRQAQIAGTVGSGAVGGVGSGSAAAASSSVGAVSMPTAVVVEPSSSRSHTGSASQFLLARYAEPLLSQHELQQAETERADRGAFVCELLMNALVEGLTAVDVPATRVLNAATPAIMATVATTTTTTTTTKTPESAAGAAAAASSIVTVAPAPTPRSSESPPSSSSSSSSSSTGSAGGASSSSSTSNRTPSGHGKSKQQQQQQQQGSARTSGATGSRNASVRDLPASTAGGGARGHQQQQQQHHPVVQQQQQQVQQPQRTAGTGTMREPLPPQVAAPDNGRLPGRSGTSPSSTSRRKMARHLDGRNQPNEPPPPH